MKSWIGRCAATIGAFGIALAAATGAHAAVITIDECPGGVCSDGPPTVTLSGFDVTIPGLTFDASFLLGFAYPEFAGIGIAPAVPPDTVPILSPGQFMTTSADVPFTAVTLNIIDNPTDRTVSDSMLLQYQVVDHVASLFAVFFSAEPEGVLGVADPSFPALVETRGFMDVSGAFFDTTNHFVVLPPELTILIRSEAPEPAPLALLALGLAAGAFARRRIAR